MEKRNYSGDSFIPIIMYHIRNSCRACFTTRNYIIIFSFNRYYIIILIYYTLYYIIIFSFNRYYIILLFININTVNININTANININQIGVEPLPISVSGSIVYFPYSIQISNVNSTSAYISIQTLSTMMY